jgi:hypothetical protein
MALLVDRERDFSRFDESRDQAKSSRLCHALQLISRGKSYVHDCTKSP